MDSDTELNDRQIQNRSLDLSFGLIVFSLNIFEIYLLVRVRKRKIFETILLSLSVADLLFGLSNAIVCILFLIDQTNAESLQTMFTTYFLFVTTSILHLTLINMDRIWTVAAPIRHKIYFTNKRVKQALAFVWTLAIVISVVLVITNKYTKTFVTKEKVTRSRNVTRTSRAANRLQTTRSTVTEMYEIEEDQNNYGTTMQLALSIVIIIADIGFIVCNSIVVYFLSRKKKVRSVTSAAQNLERKVSVICVLVTLAFILFTLPYALTRLIDGRVPVWANILLVFNSGINSFVYFFRGRIETFINNRYQDKTDSSASNASNGSGTTPLTNRQKFKLDKTEL